MLQSLQHIINLSLNEGKFDSSWKPQIIAPHFKKDDRTLMNNYRPVSNIVELGKLVEMEVGDQIVEDFTLHHLFHDSHHGSLPSLDTTTAFDLVDHEILLGKLKAYNFGPGPYAWFKSYLENRTYKYKVEARTSTSRATGRCLG